MSAGTALDTRPSRDAVAPRRRNWSKLAHRAPFYLVLLVLTVIFVAPLVWMFLTSFKTKFDAIRLPLSWLPRPFTSEEYKPLMSTTAETPVIRWFINSLIAATAQSVLIVATSSAAAYALARMEFAGRRLVFGLVVGTLFVPSFVFLIPNFLIVNQFGWLDSLWSVIVPGVGNAFGVFFMRQFYLSLPMELEEAAVLDGANHWQIFTRVVLPLAKPALATLAVLAYLTNWNDFVWPVYVLFNPQHLTLPAGLASLQDAANINYPLVMAGAVIASVPVLVIFVLAQRHVIQSVARSGLKG
ncbi:MAG TPA: carbohydrate ABC transporter permease [Acidothermaceae bacterium]|jgi:multiple sugar transport system permease protein|nr:carbohydrate ABC transporter permease [Acidothermaceae bacterium]